MIKIIYRSGVALRQLAEVEQSVNNVTMNLSLVVSHLLLINQRKLIIE
jgi:hypothetical protein